MEEQNKKEILPPAKSPNEKKVLKKIPVEEVKDIVMTIAKAQGGLSSNIKKLSEDILPKFFHGTEEEKKGMETKIEKMIPETMMALSPESHWDLIESFNPNYRGLVVELAEQIIKEYDCKIHSEKVLASLVANAYVRVIDNSRRFNDCAEAGQHIHDGRTRHLAMLSKQIDRANRQFLSALMALKQIKSPTIEMNIKTKNTFIAQNQQINANPENNESK